MLPKYMHIATPTTKKYSNEETIRINIKIEKKILIP
jgi:hypothetical protein